MILNKSWNKKNKNKEIINIDYHQFSLYLILDLLARIFPSYYHRLMNCFQECFHQKNLYYIMVLLLHHLTWFSVLSSSFSFW